MLTKYIYLKAISRKQEKILDSQLIWKHNDPPVNLIIEFESHQLKTVGNKKSHPQGANAALSQHRWRYGCEVMAKNMFSDLLTLSFDLGHSKSIGFLGPIRSYLGPSLKFIS